MDELETLVRAYAREMKENVWEDEQYLFARKKSLYLALFAIEEELRDVRTPKFGAKEEQFLFENGHPGWE